MKNLTQFFLAFLLLAVSFGQLSAQAVSSYSFAESTETYAQITGTTSTATGDDGSQDGIAIGFTFNFGGVNYTTFSINANGFIRLGSAIGSSPWTNSLSNTASQRPLIAGFWDDNNLSTGTIQYALTGSSPNQVLTVNWHNFKAGGTGSTAGASISTLIRLYETTNVVELVYGSPFTTTNSVSASVGLNDMTSFLSVTPAATSTVSSTTPNNAISQTVMANLAGKKLTFTPPPPCTGTPTAGTVAPALQNVCPGTTPGAITLSGTSTGTGLTFQWQESSDDTDFVDVTTGTGATTKVYTPAAFSGDKVWYRCKVTCTTSTEVDYSTSSQIDAPAAPTTQASNIIARPSNAAATSAAISWTSGNGGRRFVVVNTTNSFTDPVDGSTLPGSVSSTYAGGEQIVYDGTASSVTISGLNCAQEYYIRVYEYRLCTSGGNTYYFNVDPSTDNPRAFNNAATSPTLENFDALTAVPHNWFALTGSWSVAASHGLSGNAIYTNVWSSATTASLRSGKIATGTNDVVKFSARVLNYTSGTYPGTQAAPTGDFGTFYVEVSDDCGGSYTTASTIPAASIGGSYAEFTTSLAAWPEKEVIIRIRTVLGTNTVADYFFDVDNFIVEEAPACFAPVSLAGSYSCSDAKATFTWADGGSSATAYDVYYTASVTAPDGSTTPTEAGITDFTYLSGALDLSTTYYFYVRANCGVDVSDWAGPFTLVTPTVVAAPFETSFDAVPAWAVTGAGWSLDATHGNPTNGVTTNLYSSFPATTLTTTGYSDITADYVLEFDTRVLNYSSYPNGGTPSGNYGSMAIQISTDCGTTFSVLEAAIPLTGTWALYSKSLADYAGENIFLRFVGTRLSGDWYFDMDNFYIGPPCIATVTDVALTQPTCAVPTGAIEITATGTGALEYSVDGGTSWGTENVIDALAPGDYTVRVREAALPSCEFIQPGTYTINPALSAPVIVDTTVVQPTCDFFFGSIEIEATGAGTLEYSLTPSDPLSWQTAPLFENLAPRKYRPAVRLASDPTCVVLTPTNPITIWTVTELTVTTTPTHILCPGGANNGKITADPVGGVKPYSYAWSNSGTSKTITGLAAGTYTLVVTDALGCTVETSETVTSPEPVTGTPEIVQPTCAEPTAGSIKVNGVSGTATLEFSINGGTDWSSSDEFVGLGAGTYALRVRFTDNPTCVRSLGNASLEVGTIPVLSMPTVTQPTCTYFLGSIAYSATASGPVEYSLTPSLGDSWQSSGSFVDLPGRLYRPAARLISDTTCVVLSTNDPIQILKVTELLASIEPTGTTCYGASNGKAIATATGGVKPYTYAWSNMATGRTASGLAAGTYSVIVTDARACTVEESVMVTQPDSISFSVLFSGSDPITATVIPTGGTAPYTYAIDAGAYQTSNEFVLPAPGRYTFRVKDANGCTKSLRLLASGTAPMVVNDTELNDTSVERNEVTSATALALYPNPSTGRVVLELLGTNSSENNILVVTNALGQTVLQQKLYTLAGEASVLDFSYLTSGIYNVTLIQSNGVKLTERLIIAK